MRQRFILLACICAGLGLTRASGSSNTHVYVEPGVVYAMPGSDIKNAVGASLAVGYSFHQMHAVEVEVMQFKSDVDDYFLPNIKFTPLWAKYKVTFDLNRTWSAYGAIGGGAMWEQATEYFYNYYGPVSHPIKQTPAFFGSELGVKAKLSDRVALGIGTTVFGVDKSDLTTRGSMVVLTLKVAVRL